MSTGPKCQDRIVEVIAHCQAAMAEHAKRRGHYSRLAHQWKIGVEAAMAQLEADREAALVHAHAQVLAILGALTELPLRPVP